MHPSVLTISADETPYRARGWLGVSIDPEQHTPASLVLSLRELRISALLEEASHARRIWRVEETELQILGRRTERIVLEE